MMGKSKEQGEQKSAQMEMSTINIVGCMFGFLFLG